MEKETYLEIPGLGYGGAPAVFRVVCGDTLVPERSSRIALDTETEMIVKGQPYVPVLLQVYYLDSGTTHVLQEAAIRPYLRQMLELNPTSQLCGHNWAFDFEVLGGRDNPLLFQAVEENRVVDTGLRYLLRELDSGRWLKGKKLWNLAHVAKMLLGIELAKDDEVRLTFTCGMELSEVHLKYAAMDAIVTGYCWNAMPHPYATEDIQIKGAIALHDIGFRGLRVDRAYMDKLRDKLSHEAEMYLQTLGIFGYMPGTSGNQSVQQEMLHNISERTGANIPRTPSGKYSTSKETIANLGDNLHPFITAMQQHAGVTKVLSTFLNPEYLGVDGRVHSRFEPMVVTGRTSSSNPNIQNPPRSGGVREQYIPRDKCVLAAVDYSQLELCALAQTCYKNYGVSVMRDVINSGVDIHLWFGDKIKERVTDLNGVKFRQMAKACYSADTEVLTPLGWKHVDVMYYRYHNLKHRFGDYLPVAQYNPDKHCLEWVRPLEWMRFPDKELMRVTSTGVDLLVTPDHRMFVTKLGGRYGEMQAQHLSPGCGQFTGFSVETDALGLPQDIHNKAPWYTGSDLLKTSMLPGRHTVYCLSVPSSWVLVRRNGLQSVQGNCNFGYPGGLSPESFVAFAKATYGVDVSLELSIALKELWLETFPEAKLHLKPPADPQNPGMYLGKTLTGRIRRNATYNAACNAPFQGLAADGAKRALWLCYVARLWMANFVHDEILAELPICPQLSQMVDLIGEFMIEGMRVVIPDVNIKVEATLMHRWNKKAEPIFNPKGELLVWTEDVKYLSDEVKKLTLEEQLATMPADHRPVWADKQATTIRGWQPLCSAIN